MAGRIRTIKPEWLDNERLAGCSDAARVLSVALMLLADDHGNGRGAVGYLHAQCWAYSRNPRESLAKVREGLRELVLAGFVVLYQVEGQSYYHLPGWAKHQRVDKPGKPRVPLPEIDTIREGLAKVRGSLAPDHDHDHDHDQDLDPDPEGESEGGGVRAEGTGVGRSSGKRKKAETELPEDWEPTARHRDYAASHGIDLDHHAHAFRAHAESCGRRAVSWNGAFATWLSKAAEKVKERHGARQPTAADLWAQAEQLEREGR